MAKCCITGCYSNARKNNEGLSFFRFPNNEALRKLWMENIGTENIKPARVLRICSKHFEAICVNRTLGVVRLKDDVVPTIFPHVTKDIDVIPVCIHPTTMEIDTINSQLKQNTTNSDENSKTMAANATEKVQKLCRKVKLQQKKIKTLSQKCRRLKQKVSTFQKIIDNLKKHNLVPHEGATLLEECAE